ncbi:MAG: hypothetical protein M3253_00630, partial [Chloroflexota bacterium]|nr:hypothetical protein [Chloroflexota bacterium]
MGLDPRYPHELSHRDWTVLLCHPDGAIPGSDGCGLYHHECRILSGYRLTLEGLEPDWVSSRAMEADEWAASLRLARPGPGPDGPELPQDAIEVRLRRLIGGGMLELIEVHNHSMVQRTVELAVELRADFADILEVAQGRRQQDGDVTLRAGHQATAISYRATRGDRQTERGLRVRRVAGDIKIETVEADVALRLTATLVLAARGTWSASVAYEPLVDARWRPPDGATAAWQAGQRAREAWRRRRPRLHSTSPTLERVWGLAAEDLYALRNRELDGRERGAWVVNAGVPVFTGLFGRDVLTTGWQGALIGPQWMRGALDITARLQATSDDPWLDAEPGKLIHELRRGPLADLRITAQAGYYGTQTTAAMFALALTELWHWTADTHVLRRQRATAERALEWARQYGDLDGDGFLEYQQRSPVGIKNQAWKDSDEAIRYPDGGQVANPIAAVEEQAFHFLALCRAAEMCVALEDDKAADGYVERARKLRDDWDAAYWMPEAGFYAMALDSDKRQVRSIGSNAGHALGAGIVPREKAAAVADRLMASDMFSGWGIRTLSDKHPSYNPWGYHLGT